ncbi:hypothetical protein KFE98_20745 [bacterium SCSIO 12741]|nr:hypothetical protein KFE98_20745 [bacterium SCSIO 12741]
MPFSKTRFKDFTEGAKFTLLEENEPHEFLYGFWAKKHIEWIADKEAYIQGGKGYRMLIAWNFEFKELENNECLVSTETRVKCLTTGTKIIFSIYWFFVKPFSGWIRNEMLRLVKKKVNERLSN